jgi:hypothetical protein
VVEAPAETPVVEAAPIETEAQARERDEKGRFKPKAEEPQDQTMVPLTALHETRDKVRALEAELQKLRPQQQADPVPDIFEDPEGYQNQVAQTIQQATLNATLNLSEEMVRQSSGNETVDAAQQWAAAAFKANPALWQQFISQRNPYGFLVQEYQRHTALTKLGDPKDIDAFLAWRQAQAQLQPAQAAPQPATPPPSIASAPSAGGIQQIATGPGVAFSEMIK